MMEILYRSVMALAVMSYAGQCCSQVLLSKGVAVTGDNLSSLVASSDEYDVAFSSQVDFAGDSDVKAFILLNDNRNLISFSGKKIIYLSDFIEKKFIASWPLSKYSEEALLFGEGLVAAPFIAAEFGEEYPELMPLDSLEIKKSPSYIFDNKYSDGLGCLQRFPMRFGDIDNNSENELVFYIGNSLILFSMSTHAVSYSMKWRTQDELTSLEYLPEEVELGAPNEPQYIAESGLDPSVGRVLPARRAYAKNYFGDFDGDENKDIILWRKLYESRLNGDPIAGFQLIGEKYIHYELSENRYQIQDTQSALVADWLVENNLKWSDGYPALSECEIDNGTLIPELHDRKLNDPSVLQ